MICFILVLAEGERCDGGSTDDDNNGLYGIKLYYYNSAHSSFHTIKMVHL